MDPRQTPSKAVSYIHVVEKPELSSVLRLQQSYLKERLRTRPTGAEDCDQEVWKTMDAPHPAPGNFKTGSMGQMSWALDYIITLTIFMIARMYCSMSRRP